jgi:hypothetical protein
MTPEETVRLAHEGIERADQEIRRAEEAKAVLEMPIIRQALDSMEHEVYEAWLACPSRDAEGREWMWRQAQAIRKFRETLRGTMELGKPAAERKMAFIERIKSAAKKAANWG